MSSRELANLVLAILACLALLAAGSLFTNDGSWAFASGESSVSQDRQSVLAGCLDLD